MPSDFYGVIIGFNNYKAVNNLPRLQYAENDATSLYNLLIDPNIGGCLEDNLKLITDEISTKELKIALFENIVQDRKENDTVLVYYSGHGFFAGPDEKAYFGVPTVENVITTDDPGLGMDYLYKEIFLKTRARSVIFFLDCCYSGAFILGHKIGRKPNKYLVEDRFFSREGRVAFVSSSKDVQSRESKSFLHGVFTFNLLNGLGGKAIDPRGDVTMSSLIAYVEGMSPHDQLPMMYGNASKIIITHPKVNRSYALKIASHKDINIQTEHKLPAEFPVHPLRNPIEAHVEYIELLTKKLEQVAQDSKIDTGTKMLNAIQSSLGSDLVFIQRIGEKESFTRVQSDSGIASDIADIYRENILNEIKPFFFASKAQLMPGKFGISQPLGNYKGKPKNIVIVPLLFELPREFLIISGVSQEKLKYGEILGHTLLSLYHSSREFTSLNLLKVEMSLLDDLKKDFGQVPYSLYKHRFDKFKEHLHKIKFAFEPIVCLRKNRPFVDSWEALARDPETNRAPFDLFLASELWGREFSTELDLYCLRGAISTYVSKWDEERPGQKLDNLSVNVYPETLYRKSYQNAIKHIVEEQELIMGEQLILELSEKKPIVRNDNTPINIDPVDAFMEIMHEYSDKFNVGFSIDDFGVEHSSIARLARLQLDHVKIDRDILHHQFPASTIKYVMNLVSQSHLHAKKVIVEGFDEDSNLSLPELFKDCKIKYIQGHLIRRASESVLDLDQSTKDLIVSLLST